MYDGFMRSAWKLLILVVVVTVSAVVWPRSSQATLEACSASISPSTVKTSVSTNFSFTLTNNGSNPILYFKVTTPSSNLTIQGKDAGGWSSTSDSSTAQFWGSSVAPGATFNFTILASSGSTEQLSANWLVDANDVLSADGTTRCSGSLGVAIEGVSDIVGPIISDPTVTSITATSATVGWTTDEPSNSLVYYGLGSGIYGLSSENGSYVTTHSMILTSGLAASTTYYYYVCSIDEAGNQSCGDESLFTTAAVSTATTTTTTTTTATPTPTPTATPRASTAPAASAAPVVIVDLTRPVVDFTPELENPYEESPEMRGTATDNREVTSVWYSTDGGGNWVRIESVEGIGTKEVSYTFTPEIAEDNNYEIVVRALDSSGNEGVSEGVTVVIDRLPPRVGAALLTLGPYALLPNREGVIVTTVGVEEKITMSAVGGATAVDLIALFGDDPSASSEQASEKMFSLGKSGESGLWNGAIFFSKSGLYELRVRAIDGAGNETERSLGMVLAVSRGRVERGDGKDNYTDAEITIYVQDKGSKLWTKWDGRAFGQENPQELSSVGEFEYFLPPGSYYLTVKLKGLPKLTSEIFALSRSTPFNPILRMPVREYWEWGPIKFPKPDWLMPKGEVKLTAPKTEEFEVSEAVGKLVPQFELEGTDGQTITQDQYNGEKYVITFVTSWSPQALEQIVQLNKAKDGLRQIVVAGQETKARMRILLKRGGYRVPIYADPYGELTEQLMVAAVPSHYLVDQEGIVVKQMVGVLSTEELKDELGQIGPRY